MADPKIKIRRSATPNKVPTKDQLQSSLGDFFKKQDTYGES